MRIPAGAAGSGAGRRLALLVIASLLATSQLAVALVNWLATLLVRRGCCRGWTSRDGIPAECAHAGRGADDADRAARRRGAVEALEVRFLANRDANLHFALLTDFRDAAAETLPDDEPLLQLARRESRS